MQRLKFLLTLMALFTMVMHMNAQSDAVSKNRLSIPQPAHDFGRIAQGKPVFHEFRVVNPTTSVVSMENVQASCGCTTPEWSREPIPPGESSIIRVGYNAAATGYFEKTIMVFHSGGESIQLNIKGEVWETPVQPAPSNLRLNRLKSLKFQ